MNRFAQEAPSAFPDLAMAEAPAEDASTENPAEATIPAETRERVQRLNPLLAGSLLAEIAKELETESI